MNILRIHLEGGASSITVFLQIETYIDALAVLQMFGLIALPERNAIHGHYTISEVKMQMFTVTYCARVPVIDEVAAEEERAFVGRPKGLQTLKNLIHLPVHIAQLHFGFDV